MVKLVVVLPGESIHDEMSCPTCSNCVITNQTVNDFETVLRNIAPQSTSTIQRNDDEVFLNFFELMVCSVSTSEHLSAWKWVVGSKATKPINAGYTHMKQASVLGKGSFGGKKKGRKDARKNQNATPSNKMTLDDAMHRAHDAGKVIFFSAIQVDLLNAPELICMLLWGDYGTGV